MLLLSIANDIAVYFLEGDPNEDRNSFICASTLPGDSYFLPRADLSCVLRELWLIFFSIFALYRGEYVR